MLARIRAYIRQHHLALFALFITLGGTAFATSKLDANHASDKFGSSVYFGSVDNFGPVTDQGIGNAVPLIGRIDTNMGLDASGGPYTLLAPVALRLQDLSFRTTPPVDRPVKLQFFRRNPDLGHVILGCTIKTGERGCTDKGPGPTVPRGTTVSGMILAPPQTGTLSERDYDFAYRIVPG